MNREINLIFMGGFTYPQGMAGTKRIQNLINALKDFSEVHSQVIIQRQFKQDNALSGIYDGTHYQIISEDLIGAKLLFALPMHYYKTIKALKTAFQPMNKNVIYFYGPLFFDSIVPLFYAKKLGYKIIFDFVEDFSLLKSVATSYYHSTRYRFANILSLQGINLSSGNIVISTHLEKKVWESTKGKAPIHYMPISVDMASFPVKQTKEKDKKTLFYAGSFGKKDGIAILLDAFDKLAKKKNNIYLVLTGRSDKNLMNEFYRLLEKSSYKDRISYKGYLDEDDYYALLNDVDIPCMTRDDVAFAHAGFPFKLGEFLATGKPVIASRVSDVERFLVHKDNSMLVRPGSSEDICYAVEYLLDNPGSAKEIGKKGREVAKLFFEHKKQGKELLSFIKNICERQR